MFDSEVSECPAQVCWQSYYKFRYQERLITCYSYNKKYLLKDFFTILKIIKNLHSVV